MGWDFAYGRCLDKGMGTHIQKDRLVIPVARNQCPRRVAHAKLIPMTLTTPLGEKRIFSDLKLAIFFISLLFSLLSGFIELATAASGILAARALCRLTFHRPKLTAVSNLYWALYGLIEGGEDSYIKQITKATWSTWYSTSIFRHWISMHFILRACCAPTAQHSCIREDSGFQASSQPVYQPATLSSMVHQTCFRRAKENNQASYTCHNWYFDSLYHTDLSQRKTVDSAVRMKWACFTWPISFSLITSGSDLVCLSELQLAQRIIMEAPS